MCVNIFSAVFIILSLISIVQMLLLDFGITKKMKPMGASAFVSSAAAVLFLYTVSAIALSIIYFDIKSFVLLGFAAVPFIIGISAEYKTHKFFTAIQNFGMFCGIIYVGYFLY